MIMTYQNMYCIPNGTLPIYTLNTGADFIFTLWPIVYLPSQLVSESLNISISVHCTVRNVAQVTMQSLNVLYHCSSPKTAVI